MLQYRHERTTGTSATVTPAFTIPLARSTSARRSHSESPLSFRRHPLNPAVCFPPRSLSDVSPVSASLAAAVEGGRRCVVVVDLDTLMAAGQATLPTTPGPTSGDGSGGGDRDAGAWGERAKAVLTRLAKRAGTVVIAVAAATRTEMADWLPADAPIVAIAEDGAFVRWSPLCAWESTLGEDPSVWLREVRPAFDYFTDRTPGSRLLDRDSQLVWRYPTTTTAAAAAPASGGSGVLAGFAEQQARDLAAAVSEYLPFLPLLCDHRPGCLTVRPSAANRGLILLRVLSTLNGFRPLHGSDTAGSPRPTAAPTLPVLRLDKAALLRSIGVAPDVPLASRPDLAGQLQAAIKAVYAHLWGAVDGGGGGISHLGCVVLLGDCGATSGGGYGHALRALQRTGECSAARLVIFHPPSALLPFLRRRNPTHAVPASRCRRLRALPGRSHGRDPPQR